MADHVDFVLEQWAAQRPDLDTSSMGVFGRLSRLSRLVSESAAEVFRAHGLDRGSFDVLATLRRTPPPHRLTPAQLMRSSMVTSGAISQRLDRLEQRELVSRSRSELDARVVYVTLTEQGRALIDRALADHVAHQQRLLAPLGEDERHALADMLRTLLESLGDTRP